MSAEHCTKAQKPPVKFFSLILQNYCKVHEEIRRAIPIHRLI